MNAFPLTKKTLSNGLRVLLLPRGERQTVTFLVLMGVGSRYESEAQWGLSHFLEHMFFKGTSTRPSAKEISEAIDRVGGDFNAFTGEEYTGYYVKVAAEHLEHGAEVVSDILLRPLFAESEIERERGVITEEIRMYTSVPMHHVEHLWQTALFGTHPLGRRIDGSEESVAAFKRADFVSYVKSHYHTDNTVVAVAGNFKEAEAVSLLERLFKPLAKGKVESPKAAPSSVPAQRIVAERRAALEQTQLEVGVPGVSLADDDRWAAELLATVLGAGMSSRLFLSVRERHGLAYTVRTSSTSYTDAGSFSTYAGVRVDKAVQAVKLILEEYDRVMEEAIPAVELDKAQEMLYGHLMLELESTNSLAVFAAGQEVLKREVLKPDAIKKHIMSVTADEVQRTAQKLLVPSRRALALLGPQRSPAAFEKILK